MSHPIVWINTVDYTLPQLAFYGLGCFLWVIAYIIYIRNIRRLQYAEMPVFAGCCDVGWEFTWSFFAYSNMGLLLQGANVVWFLLDFGYIFTLGVVRYGWKQLTVPQLQKRAVFAPICFAIAAFAAAATWFLHHQGLDNEVGGRSAYLIQLTISFLYVPLMLRQPDLRYFSYAAAWCRSLGSASVVVFFALRYPGDWFLLTIGCTSAVVDGTFLTIFTRRRWALASQESPARPATLGPLAGPVPSTLP